MMTKPRVPNAWLLLFWMSLVSPVVAGEPPENPLGEDFQINSFTASYQAASDVGLQPGGFVAVWQSDGSSQTDNDDYSIQAQRFGSDGLPLGGEFQVNTYTTGAQSYPSIAVGPTGDFVVVWQSAGSAADDGHGTSIQGRRFASDGSPLGDDFQINTYTTFDQIRPEVGIDASGDFAVVWELYAVSGIRGRRFSSEGAPSGPEVQAYVDLKSGQRRPDVAMTADGDWLVVWENGDSLNDIDGIAGIVFDSDSTPISFGFHISADTSVVASNPKVASDADENFVVVWDTRSAFGPVGSFYIRGRRLSLSTGHLSDEFQINTHTTVHQNLPAVAVEPDGDFIVAWTSEFSSGSDDSATSIQGRRFDSDGFPRGGDFQVNSWTFDYQVYPALAIDARGDFIAVWHSLSSAGSDSDNVSVQGRRFAPSKVGLLFEDGFETGDISGWSSP